MDDKPGMGLSTERSARRTAGAFFAIGLFAIASMVFRLGPFHERPP